MPPAARATRTSGDVGRMPRTAAAGDSRLVDRCLRGAGVRLFSGAVSVARGRCPGGPTVRPAAAIMPACRAAASSSPLLATQALAARALAEKPSERGGPLRLGVDRALEDSGLARRLQHAFGADTGIAVLLVPGPALAVLEAVKNGETDAALVNAPGAEEALEKEGLVHDRRTVADERVHRRRPGAGPRARAVAAAGAKRARRARAHPRPGIDRPGERRLPLRRRRLGRARRRAGALARGPDRAGRAVVRDGGTGTQLHGAGARAAAPTRWSSGAPGRPSAARR